MMSGIVFFILFNISHVSSLRCTKHFSLTSCVAMAKRIQEQKEEVSKSRPAVMNMSSYLMSSSSSAASSPIASKSPGTSGASGRPGSRMNLAASSLDAASTSQVKLKDAYHGGLKEKQRETRRIKKKKIQKTPTNLRLRSGTTKGNPLPKTVKGATPCTRSQFFS